MKGNAREGFATFTIAKKNEIPSQVDAPAHIYGIQIVWSNSQTHLVHICFVENRFDKTLETFYSVASAPRAIYFNHR